MWLHVIFLFLKNNLFFSFALSHLQFSSFEMYLHSSQFTRTPIHILCTNFGARSVLPPEVLLCTNLKELRIGFNRITALPEGISVLGKLQLLMLENNCVCAFFPSPISLLLYIFAFFAHARDKLRTLLCAFPPSASFSSFYLCFSPKDKSKS